MCGVVSRWCVCCAWCWAVQKILRRKADGAGAGRGGAGGVVDVLVVLIVDMGVQFLDTVFDMPVVVHVGFVVRKIVEVPQLQYPDEAVDVLFAQFIDGMDVPVITQRRWVSRTVEMP